MKAVQLGVLGVSGHFGLRLRIPLRDSSLINLKALGSRSLEKSRPAAAEWGFETACGSYGEVLAHPDVEAVYIPLPNDSHAEWIRRCIDAGKAVICEKPLTLNAREAAQLASHAEERGVPVMEAFMYRFHPQWLRAKDLIQTGEIGEIQSIHTVFSYKNTDPSNIRNSMERGGGGLYDIGCYAVSSARFLMGREPKRVVSMISRDPVDGTDTLTSGILDFDDARAVFTVGTRMFPCQEVQVVGSRGSLRVVLPFNAYPDVPLELVVDNGIGPRIIGCGPADQYRAMFEAFALALRGGGPVPTPLTDAVANMNVIDAMFRSGESGLWEQVGTERN